MNALFTPPVWTREDELQPHNAAGKYRGTIVPFFEQFPIEYFEGVGGKKLAAFCARHATASPAIIIVNGFTESILKYREVIYDWYQNGYSVYCFDHRGQGLSERIDSRDRELGQIDDIEYLVEDLHTFIHQFVLPNNHLRHDLLAHSMGCAVSLLYLDKYEHPFARAALCAPMVEIRMIRSWLTNVFKYGFLWWMRYFPGYVLTTGPYKDSAQLDRPTRMGHSVERNIIMRAEYRDEPLIRLGGPSYNWLYQWAWQSGILTRIIASLEVPTLIIKAGLEHVVSNSAVNAVVRSMPEAAKIEVIEIDGGYHELLRESDQFRQPTLDAIWRHFHS